MSLGETLAFWESSVTSLVFLVCLALEVHRIVIISQIQSYSTEVLLFLNRRLVYKIVYCLLLH